MARHHAAKTVDELLARARATLPDRPSPAEALRAQAGGALLIDIRGDDQRRDDGLIPGAIALPRNSLEWRCDPASEWRHPAITGRDLRIILICDQGYQSSLAAATLQQLGLIHATDLDGGFTAWAAAGLPVIAPARADRTRPAAVIAGEQHRGLTRPAGRAGVPARGRDHGVNGRPRDRRKAGHRVRARTSGTVATLN
jgi:rhodanese-related sulfurtransferase